jgi:hypothetical protein
MNKPFLAILLLAGCSGSESDGQSAAQSGKAGQGQAAPAGPITTLAGLYEGGGNGRKHQMCMVDDGQGGTRFGLLVWGDNDHSCSGSGSATRAGDTLRLAMAGDEACVIDAKISGATATFPAAIPDGCAYYCGARASMKNASLAQVATGADAAGRAKDLVGEPLCGGQAG